MRSRIARYARDVAVKSCPHRPPCPGCPRFAEPGIAPAARVALDALARTHGLPEIAEICGQTSGFRLRARLAIRGRLGSPKIGLFELGTHRVVHIPNCIVQHPLINRVAAVVRRALVDARVTSYSDKAHLGLARYLQVVVERSSQTAQVVIVGNSATCRPLCGVLGIDPGAARRRAAQFVVQRQSGALQYHPRSRLPTLVWSCERGRALWRSRSALSARCVRAEQSRDRATDDRARERSNSAGRDGRRILCRCRRDRLVALGAAQARSA